MVDYHVRVSPQLHARAKELKNALERIDLAEGRTEEQVSIEKVLTALAQIAGVLPPPSELREVVLRDNVMRLLQAESFSQQPPLLPRTQPGEAA